VYLAALDRFGNDPEAGEVGSTLAALERLVRRLGRAGGSGDGASAAIADPRMLELLSGDFDAWVDAERERARLAGEHTRHARFTLFKADRHLARKEPHQAEALVLGIAATDPIESLDAPALARVGLALQEVGSPEGASYLERLLRRHPASFERAAAFFGLAAEAAKERQTDEAMRWIARFENETPTHSLAPRAALLAGETLEQAGRFEEAAQRFEDVLRLKSARGRPHAEALMGLARCAIGTGDAKRAVAYCQRVYTLHRAQGDLAGEAYLRSGALFEALGDSAAASATYREMLRLTDVGTLPQREHAARALEALPPEPAAAAAPATSEKEPAS
jgi:tetratricopeptide (TPR) repeat protein